MSKDAPVFSPADVPANLRFAIAAARFNEDLVSALLDGCLKRFAELGVAGPRVEIMRVPGAFELPLAAQALARTGRFAAVVCLGAVVRGETPHFDYVAGQAALGIAHVSRCENLPVIFGVLTTDTPQQAWDRAGGKHGHAGQRAAEAAVEMALLMNKIKTSC
jgi:6,7-dimethyl-8-ribityllumazine synthase